MVQLNLTVRMSMRGFTRVFEEIGDLEHAIALEYMYYNFCLIHQTLRVTPTVEAGVSNHVWSLDEVMALLG